MKHILNKQKAKEIAEQYKTSFYETKKLVLWSDLEDIAMKAMQWKDEQEIEFLQSLMFQASTQQALGIIINNRIKLLKGE